MPRYVRAFVPGGTFFFTVNLLERQRTVLTDHIEWLGSSIRQVRAERPFQVHAIVVLPHTPSESPQTLLRMRAASAASSVGRNRP